MRINKKGNRGFTLIELIIVVSILAILVGILAPSYTKYVKKSKVTKCEAQRAEIEKAYQIACIEDGKLAGITDTNGDNDFVIKRLVELGYLIDGEATCPVYNEHYKTVITTDNKRQKTVQVQCSCVNNLLDYIGTANKIYGDKYSEKKSYGRESLIKDFYEQRGSLIEVASNMKSNTVFSNESLYWRPYTMKDGKVVLYASTGNDSSHAQWRASLIYVDGKIYESTVKNNNGKPDSAQMNNLYMYSGDDFEKWITDDPKGQNFKLVSNK